MFWQRPKRLVGEMSTREISIGDTMFFIKETIDTA